MWWQTLLGQKDFSSIRDRINYSPRSNSSFKEAVLFKQVQGYIQLTRTRQGRSQGEPRGPELPPIEMFQIFRLNFRWKMYKMHYFRNKFSKTPSAGGSASQALLYLQYWWPKVSWFGQIMLFQADCDEIELQKNSYDVTSVTSSPLRRRKTSPK